MIEERYCSYELCKLLKEKGFDVPCSKAYMNDSMVIKSIVQPIDFNSSGYVSRPTHQMAMDWLIEIHNIFIVVEPHMYDYINEKNSSYVTSLWQGDNYYENITSKDYPTYEDAIEAALKCSLENLI